MAKRFFYTEYVLLQPMKKPMVSIMVRMVAVAAGLGPPEVVCKILLVVALVD